MKIKLAIIGMGRMGITHYSIINNHPDVLIESVADPSTIVTSLIKKHLHVNTFKDYKKLFEKKKPDAILMCTPPHHNYEILKLAAECGIHAFVEKPFTTHYQKSIELCELFDNKLLVNQVGYVNRFNDIFQKLKSYLEVGLIGDMIRFKSEMYSCTISREDDNPGWRSSRESGGGAVFEMAAHAIDLVNYLLGKPKRVIGSVLNKVYSTQVEDAITSTLIYECGLSGILDINWSDSSYRKPTNKIEVFGKKGKLLADQHTLKIFLNEANKDFSLSKGWNTEYITDVFEPVPFYVRGNEFTRQLYHFVDCIKDKNLKTLCSFQDGSNVLEIIESIFNDYSQNRN